MKGGKRPPSLNLSPRAIVPIVHVSSLRLFPGTILKVTTRHASSSFAPLTCPGAFGKSGQKNFQSSPNETNMQISPGPRAAYIGDRPPLFTRCTNPCRSSEPNFRGAPSQQLCHLRYGKIAPDPSFRTPNPIKTRRPPASAPPEPPMENIPMRPKCPSRPGGLPVCGVHIRNRHAAPCPEYQARIGLSFLRPRLPGGNEWNRPTLSTISQPSSLCRTPHACPMVGCSLSDQREIAAS